MYFVPHLGELILTFIYLFFYVFIYISFKVIKESSRKIVPWISMTPLAIYKEILAGAGGAHLNATFHQLLYEHCPTQPLFDNDTFYYYNYGQQTVIDTNIRAQCWCKEILYTY